MLLLLIDPLLLFPLLVSNYDESINRLSMLLISSTI